MKIGLNFVLISSGTLFCIDGKHQHQNAQCILRVLDIDNIGISPIPKFLGDGGNFISGVVQDLIIPFKPVALNLPTVKINIITWCNKGEFTADTTKIPVFCINFKFGCKSRKKAESHLYNKVCFCFFFLKTIKNGDFPGIASHLHG